MTTPSAPAAQAWERDLPEVKPGLGEAGYIDDGVHSVGLPSLIEVLRQGRFKARPVVWTPEHPNLRTPAEVSALREAYQEGLRKRAFSVKLRGRSVLLGVLGIGLLLFFSTDAAAAAVRKDHADPGVYIALGIVFLISAVASEAFPRFADYRDSRRDANDLAHDESRDARHEFWVEAKSSGLSAVFVGVLGLVFLIQLPWREESVIAAGFNGNAIRQGEWWRPFTAPMLHANYFHIAANCGVISFAVDRIEAHLHRAYWPLVFLVGALYGGFASLLLMPTDKSMIGASGGAMALVGFLLVFTYRRRRELPPSLLRSLGTMIVMTAVIGAVGYKFIGNAAHAGGLAAGMLLALLLVSESRQPSPPKPVIVAGVAAAALIVASAVAAITTILRAAF